jgi:hypothetical protein
METYIVRVVLLNVEETPDDYRELHDAMKAKRFLREYPSMEDSKKVWRELPHAEYVLSAGDTDASKVRDQVQKIVEAVHDEGCQILVTRRSQGDGSHASYNLEKRPRS